MADIFISYARPDRACVEKLAGALEAEGYSIWWDRHIEGGAAFANKIEEELKASNAVIVVWSTASLTSDWVKDEAAEARDQGKLVPISIDGSLAPMGFKQYHTIDLKGWPTGAPVGAFDDLCRTVQARLTGEAAPAPQSAPKPRISPRLLLASFAGLIVIAGGLAAWRLLDKGEDAGASTAPPPADVYVHNTEAEDLVKAYAQYDEKARESAKTQTSIAVLPFTDLSREGDQQYFSDGIAEEILNVLARVDGLKVASRTSSFIYRDEDAKSASTIAGELGVRHILEGSVRKAGDTIRITAQLIDGADDAHLWSKTFDRKLSVDNILDIQDEISTAIVEELGANMGLGRADVMKFTAAAGTDNMRAYDAYLEGRQMLVARAWVNIGEMLSKLEEVVALDPKFARGWSALAAGYSVQEAWRRNDRDYQKLSIEAANRALALDPGLAMAHGVIGMASRLPDGRPDKITAIERLTTAIRLDPDEPILWGWRGQHYCELGFFDEAKRDFKKSLALNPHSPISRTWELKTLLYEGEIETAVSDLTPAALTSPYFRTYQAIAYAGYRSEKEFHQLMEEIKTDPESIPEVIDLFSKVLTDDAADADAAYEEFQRIMSGADRQFTTERPIWLYAFKQYSAIRDLPDVMGDAIWWLRAHEDYLKSPERYRLMREQGLVEYWRAKAFPPQCRPIDDERFECD